MAVDPVNILMVDDAPGKLLSYEAMLAGLGENLIKAHSAREAMAALLQYDIAVILLDVSMPEIDGFELARLVRDHPRSQRTPIIFVSAIHLSDIDKLKGYEAGAVDYVAVPVIPDILRAKVRVFVDLHRKTTELRALNDELEARVKARTIDLERSLAKLQEREVSLREADRRKDEFLALLGHELRNPLAPIRHAVDLLRRRADVAGADVKGVADVVERQVVHLTRLVDDLLDASRVSRGKVTLSKRPLELRELVREVVESARALDKSKHLFELSLAPTPIPVEGDPVRLTQVLANLVSNAVKFTREGGWIVVSAHPRDGHVQIEVADTGCGMDAADLAQVFDMFYQSDAAAGFDKGGLGLGLTLVRQFVELHGGTVTAQSEGRDKGSRIVVRLPMRETVADEAPAGTSDPASATLAPAVRSRRILIVDDNRDAALSLGELLTLEGADVAFAFDGIEATRSASEFEPHVVLLDIGLPGRDGYEVASAIRTDPRARRALIVAMTGWGQLDDKRRTAESGFDAHLVKPVSVATVLETIERLQPAIPAAS
jgi:signal transduction histidine kinase